MERLQAAVIGGGPAGLQAALTLGRMHVRTVMFDDGRYRNASSAQMHNALSRDGISPSELRAVARDELEAYSWVRVFPAEVSECRPSGAVLLLTAGGVEFETERLLIASGVVDTLLPIDGLEELWGDLVLPCPYCHGHEFSRGPIAVISSGGHAEHVGGLLRGLAGSVPVLAPEQVHHVRRSDEGVIIALRNGSEVQAACVFVPPNPKPRVSIATQLGIAAGPDGIVVDALGRTDRSRVWAAGDVAQRAHPHIPASVVTAMASGLNAAADIAADVAAARDGLAPPARI